MLLNGFSVVSHFETDGLQRYRQLRDYASRCNIHVRHIRHLRDRFNPLEEHVDEEFRLRFRLRKDSLLTSYEFGIKIVNIKQGEVCLLHSCSKL